MVYPNDLVSILSIPCPVVHTCISVIPLSNNGEIALSALMLPVFQILSFSFLGSLNSICTDGPEFSITFSINIQNFYGFSFTSKFFSPYKLRFPYHEFFNLPEICLSRRYLVLNKLNGQIRNKDSL